MKKISLKFRNHTCVYRPHFRLLIINYKIAKQFIKNQVQYDNK